MTGLPALAVYLEDATGAFTHDITTSVRVDRGWSFRRGRNDEETSVEVGSADLTLGNPDGRFTLGAPTFDGITVDKRIQVRETIGGVEYVRFTGYVQEWPTEWESAIGNYAVARINATDRQARLNRRKLLSVVENEVLLDKPLAFYRLSEPADSVSAGDFSGSGASALTASGSGAAVVFGNATGPGTDGLTAATFAAGQVLSSQGNGVFTVPAGSPNAYTTVIAFLADTTPGTDRWMFQLGDGLSPGGLYGWLDATGKINGNPASPSYRDGHWHVAHYAQVDGGNVSIYVDGVLITTAGPVLIPSVALSLIIGAAASPVLAPWIGSLCHLAVFGEALSPTRIAAQAEAILTGFDEDTADLRLARLADYANIPTADLDLETGISPIAKASTTGQSVQDAAADVVTAEGGVAFFAGDGTYTFHNREHRVRAATGAPALVISAADVEPDLEISGDKDYLVNTATGSRSGGAEQRVANQDSLDRYDEYPSGGSSGLLLTTDDEVRDLLSWQVGTYGEVGQRVKSVTLDLRTLPDSVVQAALALELGDYIQITDLPTQVAASTIDLIVEGIKEDQSLTERNSKWNLVLNTAPAELFRVWILGDPVYGVLGDTTRLHW